MGLNKGAFSSRARGRKENDSVVVLSPPMHGNGEGTGNIKKEETHALLLHAVVIVLKELRLLSDRNYALKPFCFFSMVKEK